MTATDDPPRQIAPPTRGRPFGRGNPGRPAGSRNKATVLLDKLADDDAADVLRAVLAAAKGGDMRAAEILLSRIWPPRKGRPVLIDLPEIATAADVLAGLGAVIDATASGQLTPDEAATVAGILDNKRRAIATVDIEARLAALETMKGTHR